MGIKAWWNRVFNPPEPLTIYTVDTHSPPLRASARRDDHPFEQHKVRSLMGRGVIMTGDITSEVGMVIDGHLKGRITMTGEGTALIVRTGGCIEGPVSGPIIVIRGTVIGDVQGHFVRLYPGARVEGAVAAKRLIIDDGAEVNSARIGAGEWVAPALEHLPAVDPNASAALPAPTSAMDVDAESTPPAPASALPEYNERGPVQSPMAWPAGADIGGAAEVIQMPVAAPTARGKSGKRTKKPQHSPAAARASPPHWRWSPLPASIQHADLSSALDACRRPPQDRQNGAALNGQHMARAA